MNAIVNDVPVDEFVHSCSTRTKFGDAVVIKKYVHQGNTITPVLEVIENPKRYYWTTKPGLRIHPYKKEREELVNLDQHITANSDLAASLHQSLHGFCPNGYIDRRKLLDSPYVYGADIDMQVLIKKKRRDLFTASNIAPTPVTTGFLDTETSVLTDSYGTLLLITVTHETKVYTGILRSFFYKVDDKGNRHPGELDEVIALSQDALKEYNKKHGFTYEYFIGETPGELVQWAMNQIHKNKTDFIGIWNMEFDIGVLMKMCRLERLKFEDVFCPPEVPQQYRQFHFSYDAKKTDHITKKWHWVHNTAYHQFVDSMCLYSAVRTVAGKEQSYKLDDILRTNGISDGKLTFKTGNPDVDHLSGTEYHRYMQVNRFYEYIVYNQFDAISLQIMEWKNRDIEGMVKSIGPSHLSKFVRQTRRMSDDLYFDCLSKNTVLGCVGTTAETPFDKYVTKVGGAVLRAERTVGIGLRIFRDATRVETMLHNFVSDIDLSSQYPTMTDVGNYSRETKLSTAICIEGMNARETQYLHSLLVSIPENAVMIGHKFFGLPDYLEMEKLYEAELGVMNVRN